METKQVKKNDKVKYTELSRAQVSASRNLVISSRSFGGFTIAQQIEVNEPGKKTMIFLKGAVHVAGLEGLYSIRDAVSLAIMYAESENDDMDSDGVIPSMDEDDPNDLWED